MMYRVTTLRRAKKDLNNIFSYITEELNDSLLAISLLDAIEAQILSLTTMPNRFALVDDERLAKQGYRLIPVKNHLIFYIVDEQVKRVSIVGVLHSKRNWIDLL